MLNVFHAARREGTKMRRPPTVARLVSTNLIASSIFILPYMIETIENLQNI